MRKPTLVPFASEVVTYSWLFGQMRAALQDLCLVEVFPYHACFSVHAVDNVFNRSLVDRASLVHGRTGEEPSSAFGLNEGTSHAYVFTAHGSILDRNLGEARTFIFLKVGHASIHMREVCGAAHNQQEVYDVDQILVEVVCDANLILGELFIVDEILEEGHLASVSDADQNASVSHQDEAIHDHDAINEFISAVTLASSLSSFSSHLSSSSCNFSVPQY